MRHLSRLLHAFSLLSGNGVRRPLGDPDRLLPQDRAPLCAHARLPVFQAEDLALEPTGPAFQLHSRRISQAIDELVADLGDEFYLPRTTAHTYLQYPKFPNPP